MSFIKNGKPFILNQKKILIETYTENKNTPIWNQPETFLSL